MNRQPQTEMTIPGFDCFALIQDVLADPFQQELERNQARAIIEELNRKQIALPIMGESNAI